MADEAENKDAETAEAPKKGAKKAERPKIGTVTLTKVKFLEDDERGRWKKGYVHEFDTPTAASLIELGEAKYESGTKITPPKKAESDED